MAILFCSPVSGGCGFIGQADKFDSDNIWVYCPNCHGDHTFQVTPDNLFDLIKDDEILNRARELLVADNEAQGLCFHCQAVHPIRVNPRAPVGYVMARHRTLNETGPWCKGEGEIPQAIFNFKKIEKRAWG